MLYGTPLNTIKPQGLMKKTLADWRQQMSRLNNGETPEWDNTKDNKIQVGDSFAFVNNKLNQMQMFNVIRLKTIATRPAEWNILEHANRTVIVLSRDTHIQNFMEYKRRVGYKENYIMHGTCRMQEDN